MRFTASSFNYFYSVLLILAAAIAIIHIFTYTCGFFFLRFFSFTEPILVTYAVKTFNLVQLALIVKQKNPKKVSYILF